MAMLRTVPRVRGIGRVADNPKAIMLYFDDALSDEQMRTLHDEINEFIAVSNLTVEREIVRKSH